MKLEIGKLYRTRNGKIVEIISTVINSDETIHYHGICSQTPIQERVWYQNGINVFHSKTGCNPGLDIMNEYHYATDIKVGDTPIEKFQGIDATLAERGQRYGQFTEHARIAQNLKRAMQDSPNWTKLSDDKKEALDMVQHKIARILNGDPNYADSWHDIIGYTKLVEDTLV